MKNYTRDGNTVDYINAGSAIVSGAIVVTGHTIGVAMSDIATGETGPLMIRGQVKVPKVSGAVFVVGEKLVYDVSAGAFDDSAATPATGDITGGAIAAIAGANGELFCEVILTPGNATKT